MHGKFCMGGFARGTFTWEVLQGNFCMGSFAGELLPFPVVGRAGVLRVGGGGHPKATAWTV